MIYRQQQEEKDRHTLNLSLLADRMDEVTGKMLADAAEYIDWLFGLVEKNVDFCHFCCRKPATKLCDMPNPRPMIGHPSEPTCSLPMCDDCAIEYGVGHICPECVVRVKRLGGAE